MSVPKKINALFDIEHIGAAELQVKPRMYEFINPSAALVEICLVIAEKQEIITIPYVIVDFQLMLAEQIKLGKVKVAVPNARKVADWRVFSAAERINVVLKYAEKLRVAYFRFVLGKQ